MFAKVSLEVWWSAKQRSLLTDRRTKSVWQTGDNRLTNPWLDIRFKIENIKTCNSRGIRPAIICLKTLQVRGSVFIPIFFRFFNISFKLFLLNQSINFLQLDLLEKCDFTKFKLRKLNYHYIYFLRENNPNRII